MTRRRLMTGAATLALVLGCRPATNDATTDEAAQLLAVDREWGTMVATSRNVESVIAYWADDARVVNERQPVISGKAALRQMVAGAMSVPGLRMSWTPDRAVVARSGDLGYTYGTAEVSAPDSTGQLVTTRGRYLLVWRKDADGRWRCVQDYGSNEP